MPLPDEGLIHAWLDDQLPSDEAARVEQLVATDADWAAAAAEARGLIAASSRIVSALDHVPAGVLPKKATRPATRRLPWWTKAAAAVVLVAGATTVVLRRSPELVVATVPAVARAPQVEATPPKRIQLPAAQPPSVKAPSAMRATAPRPATDVSMRMAAKDASPKPAMTDSSPSTRAFNPARLALQEVVTTAVGAAAPAVAAPSPADADSGRRFARAADATRRMPTNLTGVVVTGMPAQRTSAEPDVAKAMVTAAPVPAPKAVGGVARQESLNVAAHPGACYELRDSRTMAPVGTVMKVDRVEADTLRLVAVRPSSALRAWLVMRDSTARGVLTTAPEARGMVLVTATPVPCPAP